MLACAVVVLLTFVETARSIQSILKAINEKKEKLVYNRGLKGYIVNALIMAFDCWLIFLIARTLV